MADPANLMSHSSVTARDRRLTWLVNLVGILYRQHGPRVHAQESQRLARLAALHTLTYGRGISTTEYLIVLTHIGCTHTL
eukprot:scaffold12664_cov33-Prasinocladus_malaysianus.AAC.1